MTKTVLLLRRVAQGGMHRHLEVLTSQLCQYDWRVLIAGPPNPRSRQYRLPDLCLPIEEGIHFSQDWKSIAMLKSYLRSNQVDLVHAHGWKAALVAELSRCGVPVLVTIHNNLPPQFSGYKQKLLEYTAKVALHLADKVIVVSTALSETITRIYPPVASKLHIIPNGIDVQYVRSASCRVRKNKRTTLQALGINTTPRFILGTVTRLIREKGVFELITAFEDVSTAIPDTILVIVGDGPVREELVTFLNSQTSKEQVYLLGWRDNASLLMGLFDIFVLPSWSEGMPLSIMEAMAAGVPVIATPVGGIPSVVSDGTTGKLIPARNPKALSQAITELLKSQDMRKRFSRLAYNTALKYFNQAEMVNATAKVYDSILDKTSLL